MTPQELAFIGVFTVLGIRTASWWLQNWQIREYRTDRMRAHLETKEAKWSLINLWFFRGILPRPRLTGRMGIIGLLFLALSGAGLYQTWQMGIEILYLPLLWERTAWITTTAAVLLSKIPTYFIKMYLYHQAKQVRTQAQNLTVIGITGSYGKSSTKEILVHLLQSKFGEKSVRYNPANENSEVAVARLILKNKDFFGQSEQKFLVVEMGTYKEGEITEMCDFVQPNLGLVTGMNLQHLSLFGSEDAIRKAEFEMAQYPTLQKIWYNQACPMLCQVFQTQNTTAPATPVPTTWAKNQRVSLNETQFEYEGVQMTLPWGGEFFVQNTLLALQITQAVGITPKETARTLATLPPLRRALNVSHTPSGITLLEDLYSANPDGVLQAIQHLGKVSGKRIFIGIPLLELGNKSTKIHQEIFQALKGIQAEVWWLKDDHASSAKKILGQQFHGKDTKQLENTLKYLGKGDGILLESKLPKSVLSLIQK